MHVAHRSRVEQIRARLKAFQESELPILIGATQPGPAKEFMLHAYGDMAFLLEIVEHDETSMEIVTRELQEARRTLHQARNLLAGIG